MSSTSEAERPRQRHAHLRQRHQPGHRPGAGAEQAAAGDAAAAAGRAAAGHQRHQVAQRTSCMIVGFVSDDGSMSRSDIADYVVANARRSAEPRPGRRHGPGVRLAVRDAHLARSEQARHLRADARRRHRGGAGAERAGLGGPARRHAGGRRASSSTRRSRAQERLQTAEQFRDIVLRSNPDGSVLRLGDVARVELGAETYEFMSRLQRHSRPPASPSRSRPAPTRSTTASGVEARSTS